MLDGCTLTWEDTPSEEGLRFFSVLHEYNTARAGETNYRPLTLFLRDPQGVIVGGLRGATGWGWLHVTTLVVQEHARGRGCGRRLLVEAEREALARGCGGVYLDTFSFQALPFYQKQGYTVFGTLEDYPPGHCRYFLQKRLRGGP